MQEIIRIFKALSDQNRLQILKMLEIRPLCVCEITELLQLATSTVSKHLSILRDAGFIEDYKDGKWVYYKLVTSPTDYKIKQILAFVPQWMEEYKNIEKLKTRTKMVNKNTICSFKEAK
jgi:ArsR family transcriptional regulator